MILNYLNPNSYEDINVLVEEIFDLPDVDMCGDAIEQIIYASNGNMRRMMQLLDITMETAYLENECATLINKKHALEALIAHAHKSESEFNSQDLDLLHSLVRVCKARNAFKFQFPNVPLYKYTNRSQEYNLINVVQLGSGRRATTYAFDYAYAVAKDIPTHRMIDSEKVNDQKTVTSGRWLERSAIISDELLEHAALPGKIEGVVEYIKGQSGFIICDKGEQYYFRSEDVIRADKSKTLIVAKRIRFYPTMLNDAKMAIHLEII